MFVETLDHLWLGEVFLAQYFLKFESVVGPQSGNSRVNVEPGGALPSVPASIQPWSFTRAL